MALQHKHIGNTRPAADGFGAALRRTRTDAGLSQMATAERADCEPAMISRLECGNRTPSPEMVSRLADALNLTGAARFQFISEAGYIERPLTDSQAEFLAGWRDGFTRTDRA